MKRRTQFVPRNGNVSDPEFEPGRAMAFTQTETPQRRRFVPPSVGNHSRVPLTCDPVWRWALSLAPTLMLMQAAAQTRLFRIERVAFEKKNKSRNTEWRVKQLTCHRYGAAVPPRRSPPYAEIRLITIECGAISDLRSVDAASLHSRESSRRA
jgi:hypothetical protein